MSICLEADLFYKKKGETRDGEIWKGVRSMIRGDSKSLETKRKNAFTSTAQQAILSNSNSRVSAAGAPSISKN